MTKRLHRLAREIQEQLHGCALLHDPDTWALHAPRVQLDAWATLLAWHTAGEPVTRLTDETEDAILSRPLPPDLALATAPLRRESLGIQCSERGVWVVIARHPAGVSIGVQDTVSYGFRQPLLTYIANHPGGTGYAAGYVNLIDQPTPSRLTISPGTIMDAATERVRPLGNEAITHDDYLLTLAIHVLYA